MSSNVTIFNNIYPEDKVAEGLAVCQTVSSGKCFKCPYNAQCISDESFRFPSDSACMRLKKKMLEAMK